MDTIALVRGRGAGVQVRCGLRPVFANGDSAQNPMTLLATDLVEAILVGTQGPDVTLAQVLEPLPTRWQSQLEQINQTATLLRSK